MEISVSDYKFFHAARLAEEDALRFINGRISWAKLNGVPDERDIRDQKYLERSVTELVERERVAFQAINSQAEPLECLA